MAKLTDRQVAAEFARAFPGGKNTKGQTIDQKAFIKYWTGKEDSALVSAIKNDKYAVQKTTTPSQASADTRPAHQIRWQKEANVMGDETKRKYMESIGYGWDPHNQKYQKGYKDPRPAHQIKWEFDTGNYGDATKQKYMETIGYGWVDGKGYTYGAKKGVTPKTPALTKLDEILNKLDEDNKAIINSAKDLLDETIKRGQVINPNVEITPELTAKFLKQAEGEINPYYSTQLKLARESLLIDVGYDTQQIENFERDLEKQYIKSFRGIGEGAAEAGFAQSGIRKREEGELMEGTQQQIQDTRSALEQQVGTLSRAFTQQYAGLPGYKQPNFKMAAAPTIGTNLQGTIGTFAKPATQQSVYSLSPEIYGKLIGSSEFERRGALSGRQSDLESAWRQTEANKQLRQLTL